MLVGAAFALVAPPAYPPLALVAWAAAVGVGIDFDHFACARLNAGTWRPLVGVLRRPWLVVTDPGAVFEPGDLWARQRLLSHALVGTVLVGGLWLAAPFLAAVTAVVLWVHLLADLAWDVAHTERDFRRHARALDGDADLDRPGGRD